MQKKTLQKFSPNILDSASPELKQFVLYLLETVEQLSKEIAILKDENIELKARLNQNSSNSSRPPSSDGYRKKSHTEILKEGIENKKRGGQIGHKGKQKNELFA